MLLALGCLAPVMARAQGTFTGSAEIVPALVERMYVKGMDYLVRTQSPDGSWPDAQMNKPAITGLAVVSLLAHGDDPNFGPYAQTIHRGLDFILKQQTASSGYIGPTMYNHGFATLALAESYGAVDEARLGPALQRAVKLILTVQQASSVNAWRYSPEERDADTTVSGAQMVALMAARNAGVPVPEKSVQDGLHYYYTCQTADGGIGYQSAVGPNATRTAIGCLVMALAKEKNSTAFHSAFNYLSSAQRDAQYPAYYRYYASQAYFQASPAAFDQWNHDNINELRASQAADGSWDGNIGPSFNTAGSLLSLALNYRYLPIYER
jgi:prenyltransferase beta subunit